MEAAVYAITGITVLFLGAALLVAWSRKDIPIIRGWSGAIALLCAAASALMIGNTLGFATPFIAGITAPAGEVLLLGAKLVPRDGIYVMLDLPDEPKLFWLPWDKEMAERIQELMDGGGALVTVPPYEWSWDINPPSFNELPQPKWMPEKDVESKSMAPHFSA